MSKLHSIAITAGDGGRNFFKKDGGGYMAFAKDVAESRAFAAALHESPNDGEII
jgi:hypothetical protein